MFPVRLHLPALYFNRKKCKFPRHIFHLLMPASRIRTHESLDYRHHRDFNKEEEELIKQSLSFFGLKDRQEVD